MRANILLRTLVFVLVAYKAQSSQNCDNSQDCDNSGFRFGFGWFNYINPFYKPTSCVKHKNTNVTVSPSNHSTDVDKVFDYMLSKVRQLLVDNGKTALTIPNITEPFQKLGIQGNFRSWNGSFEDLSTIYRTGDIQTELRPASLRVKFSVGLKDALLKYENYHIKFLNIGPGGRLMMKVADNSLNVDVTVSYNPKIGISRSCKVKLNHIQLEKFGDIQVDMTGLGPFNWALNMVSHWAIGTVHSDIKQDFEKVIRTNLQSVLSYGDLCRYLQS